MIGNKRTNPALSALEMLGFRVGEKNNLFKYSWHSCTFNEDV